MKIIPITALTCFALAAADKTVTYSCPSGETFQVLYQKNGARAVLVVPSKPRLTLPQVTTASGAQYSDGFTLLATKGPEASIAAGAITLKNCTDSTVKAASAAALPGRWTLSTLAGLSAKVTRPPFIEFREDGGAAGNAGCNRFSSGYTIAGAALTFKTAAVTRMACIGDAMTIEEVFLRVIERTATHVISGNTLTLRDSAGENLATFTKD